MTRRRNVTWWSSWRVHKRLLGALSGSIGFVASVIGILAAFGVFGGGSGNVFARAASNVADAGSAFLHVQIVASAAGRPSETAFLNGPEDFRTGDARVQIRIGERTLDEIVAPPFLYTHELVAGTSTRWCRSAIGAAELTGLGSLAGFSSDPSRLLMVLRDGGAAKDLGSEILFGVRTEHYAADLEVTRTVKYAHPEEQRQVAAAVDDYIRSTGSTTLPIEVWVSDDDLPRRIETTVVALAGTTFRTTVDLSDFGVSVNVQPPPATEVDSNCPGQPPPP